MVPVLGEIADATNGVIYLARGNVLNAGFSLAACVPGIGSVATIGKYANKAQNAITAGKSISKAEKQIVQRAMSLKEL